MEFIEIGKRLKQLRESLKISQYKIATLAGINQPAIYRYEGGIAFPPYSVLMWYADYFDVSMDYIFGRTENPQGKLYECKPKSLENSEELKEFIEMCFDPNSPVNARIKDTMLKMLEEQKK